MDINVPMAVITVVKNVFIPFQIVSAFTLIASRTVEIKVFIPSQVVLINSPTAVNTSVVIVEIAVHIFVKVV